MSTHPQLTPTFLSLHLRLLLGFPTWEEQGVAFYKRIFQESVSGVSYLCQGVPDSLVP